MNLKYQKLLAILLLLIAIIVVFVQFWDKDVAHSTAPDKDSSNLRKVTGRSLRSSEFKVFSTGLGELASFQRVEEFDTYRLYEKYGLERVFSPGPPPHGPESFKIYFNNKDEIIKFSFKEGSYKSVSRTETIMKRLHDVFGMEIVQIGISGFTLDDKVRMKDFLKRAPFGGYYDTREFEMTPVVFRLTRTTKMNSAAKGDLFGKNVNGFLVRTSNGPRKELINSDLPDYFPDEKIRWFWSIEAFQSELDQIAPNRKTAMQYRAPPRTLF